MNQPNNFTDPYPTYEQVREWLPSYVMGALDAEELYAIEQYFERQEGLLRQRAELELASQALAYAAPEVPLPAGVKVRLMQRVQSDVAQSDAAQSRRNPLTGAATVPTTGQKKGEYQPLMRPPRIRLQRSWGNIWLPRLAGLAATAAIALLIWNNLQLSSTLDRYDQELNNTLDRVAQVESTASQLQSSNSTLQEENRTLQARSEALQRTNNQLVETTETLQQSNQSLQQQVDVQSDQLTRFASAQRTFSLAGTVRAPAASATFFSNNEEGILVIRGLPPLAEAQTYQLWWITPEGVPQPGVLFDLTPEGEARLLDLSIPDQYADFAGVGVSIEPAGGSQAPTEVVLLSS